MNTDDLINLKKLLDEGVISEEEFEREKNKLFKTKETNKKNTGFIIGIICIVIFCIMIISANFGNNSKENVNNAKQTGINAEIKSDIPKEFNQQLPITISGKMYDNIIGFPELSVTINNTTDKNISAIKLYFSPTDVYGEEITGIFTTNELYTDDTISTGATVSKTWQMLDSTVKSGDVYVYSIYFEDGSEWGNKDAAVSEIKKYAYKFKVKY